MSNKIFIGMYRAEGQGPVKLYHTDLHKYPDWKNNMSHITDQGKEFMERAEKMSDSKLSGSSSENEITQVKSTLTPAPTPADTQGPMDGNCLTNQDFDAMIKREKALRDGKQVAPVGNADLAPKDGICHTNEDFENMLAAEKKKAPVTPGPAGPADGFCESNEDFDAMVKEDKRKAGLE